MRYRLSPLQFAALGFLIYAIYWAIILYSLDVNPGLGGLFPIGFLIFCIVTMLVDLLLQWVFKNKKTLFYIVESIILIIGVILSLISL